VPRTKESIAGCDVGLSHRAKRTASPGNMKRPLHPPLLSIEFERASKDW